MFNIRSILLTGLYLSLLPTSLGVFIPTKLDIEARGVFNPTGGVLGYRWTVPLNQLMKPPIDSTDRHDVVVLGMGPEFGQFRVGVIVSKKSKSLAHLKDLVESGASASGFGILCTEDGDVVSRGLIQQSSLEGEGVKVMERNMVINLNSFLSKSEAAWRDSRAQAMEGWNCLSDEED